MEIPGAVKYDWVGPTLSPIPEDAWNDLDNATRDRAAGSHLDGLSAPERRAWRDGRRARGGLFGLVDGCQCGGGVRTRDDDRRPFRSGARATHAEWLHRAPRTGDRRLLAARLRADLRDGRRRPPRGRRLDLQCLGLGPAAQIRARSRPGALCRRARRRAGALIAVGQRGRRHSCRWRGHRAPHPNSPARSHAQSACEQGARRGGDGAHARHLEGHLAAARPHPRL